MKSSIQILIICVFLSNFAFAQEPSETALIVQSTISHNNKVQECWSASVDPLAEDVKKAWKDYLKKKYSADVKGFGLFSKKDLLTTEQASFPNISSGMVDLYFESVDRGTGSKISLFGRNDQNQYWSSEQKPEEFQALKAMLNQFLEEYLVNYHNTLLTEAQDKLNDLHKEQENLLKNIQKNDEDVLKMEQQIVELRQENEKYARELELNKSNLEQTQQLFKVRQSKAGNIKSKFKPVN